MGEISRTKIVGIFGFIGSGKSHLTRSLRCFEELNTISKEETGVDWYNQNYGGSNPEGYERALYSEFKKDPLFLLKKSLELVDTERVNIIDSINTPLEDAFLRTYHNYLLVQIWRSREERMRSILDGRIKLVTSSEPKDTASFGGLDNLVKKYAHEGGCLHSLADAIIINRGQDISSDFMEILRVKWK